MTIDDLRRYIMKLVIAIIQPHKLEDVKKELYHEEVNLITVSEVLGHGRQKGVNDVFLEKTISAITKGARTGETGDGKIFVIDLKDCIRIRTGETGEEAIG